MAVNRIQMVVLDLDGTLYDIDDVIGCVYRSQVNFLSSKLGKEKSKIETYFTNNGIYPFVTKESKSATELFEHLGINKDEWRVFRNTHFDVRNIQKEKAVSEDVLCTIASDYILVLLSSNTKVTIDKILLHIGIPNRIFKEIICSDSFPSGQNFNKKTAMEYLAKEYGVPYGCMLSIGDRFLTDIRPMIELGGMGVLLKTPKGLRKVVTDLDGTGLSSCGQYELYSGLK